jgi:hypothetical protein
LRCSLAELILPKSTYLEALASELHIRNFLWTNNPAYTFEVFYEHNREALFGDHRVVSMFACLAVDAGRSFWVVHNQHERGRELSHVFSRRTENIQTFHARRSPSLQLAHARVLHLAKGRCKMIGPLALRGLRPACPFTR